MTEFDPRTTPRELIIAWVRMGLFIEWYAPNAGQWSASSINYNINSNLEPSYRYRARSPDA